jgi:hypothetical protein
MAYTLQTNIALNLYNICGTLVSRMRCSDPPDWRVCELFMLISRFIWHDLRSLNNCWEKIWCPRGVLDRLGKKPVMLPNLKVSVFQMRCRKLSIQIVYRTLFTKCPHTTTNKLHPGRPEWMASALSNSSTRGLRFPDCAGGGITIVVNGQQLGKQFAYQ